MFVRRIAELHGRATRDRAARVPCVVPRRASDCDRVAGRRPSGQVAIGARQQIGECEVAGAGFLRGGEVGVLPVAGRLG